MRVVDTGSGIEPEHLPRVYDRFYCALQHSDRDRAGLGLAIVKRTMDLHGEPVRILSGTGTGTTVEFTLPRPAPTSRPQLHRPRKYPAARDKRVIGA